MICNTAHRLWHSRSAGSRFGNRVPLFGLLGARLLPYVGQITGISLCLSAGKHKFFPYELPQLIGGGMRFQRTSKALGMMAIAALALTGCGAGGGSTASGSGSAGGDTSKVILADGSEPQNPLIPANTNEIGGGKIIDSIFAGLVNYTRDGTPENDVAESIEANDDQTATPSRSRRARSSPTVRTSRPSPSSTPGTSALPPRTRSSAATSSRTSRATTRHVRAPRETVSGLVVVDDTTFTIHLKSAASDFPLRLGYSAFYPLPSALSTTRGASVRTRSATARTCSPRAPGSTTSRSTSS